MTYKKGQKVRWLVLPEDLIGKIIGFGEADGETLYLLEFKDHKDVLVTAEEIEPVK